MTAAAVVVPSLEVQEIRIDLIDPCPSNPRKSVDPGQLAELAQSICEIGVTTPVTLRPGWAPVDATKRYELVAGHRRVEASKLAGLDRVPGIVRMLSDSEALDLALIDNLQRVDLSPMEEADGYRVLIRAMGDPDPQLCAEAIARKAGKTTPYVVQRLKLLQLIPEAQDALRGGSLNLTLALLIAKLQPKEQDPALIEALDPKKLSRGKKTLFEFVEAATKRLKDSPHWARVATESEMRGWIAEHVTLQLKSVPWALDDAELVPHAGACTDCPKRAGNNAALFGDLTALEDTCTDPGCFGGKKKAFVKLTVRESVQDGKPLIKLSTSQSTLPIKEGSELEKTTFKQGQWVPAKKGECSNTFRGITQEGELKTVCVDQACKVHKHVVVKPGVKSSSSSESWEQRGKEREAKEKAYLESELPIREAVYAAIVKDGAAKTEELLRFLLMSFDPRGDGAERIAKKHGIKLRDRWNYQPIRDAIAAAKPQQMHAWAQDLLCIPEIHPSTRRYDDVKGDRADLWSVAKLYGVDADAIAKKSEKASPKAQSSSAKPPASKAAAKPAAKKSAAKKAAKKGGKR